MKVSGHTECLLPFCCRSLFHECCRSSFISGLLFSLNSQTIFSTLIHSFLHISFFHCVATVSFLNTFYGLCFLCFLSLSLASILTVNTTFSFVLKYFILSLLLLITVPAKLKLDPAISWGCCVLDTGEIPFPRHYPGSRPLSVFCS